MTKKIRILFVFITVILGGFIVAAGCSSDTTKKDEPEPSPTPSPTPGPTPSPEPEPTGGPARVEMMTVVDKILNKVEIVDGEEIREDTIKETDFDYDEQGRAKKQSVTEEGETITATITYSENTARVESSETGWFSQQDLLLDAQGRRIQSDSTIELPSDPGEPLNWLIVRQKTLYVGNSDKLDKTETYVFGVVDGDPEGSDEYPSLVFDIDYDDSSNPNLFTENRAPFTIPNEGDRRFIMTYDDDGCIATSQTFEMQNIAGELTEVHLEDMDRTYNCHFTEGRLTSRDRLETVEGDLIPVEKEEYEYYDSGFLSRTTRSELDRDAADETWNMILIQDYTYTEVSKAPRLIIDPLRAAMLGVDVDDLNIAVPMVF